MSTTGVKKAQKLALAVRDFALPVPRTGSIEVHSGYGPLPQQGALIHSELQEVRRSRDPAYVAEHAVAYTFASDELAVRVSGRVDGLYGGLTPVFEEIKTAFDAPELARRLRKQPWHPYWLQLLTYMYIHFKNTGVLGQGQILVVSSRNREETVLPVSLDVGAYESWLELRLAELRAEEVVIARRQKRRREVGKGLAFPFAGQRSGQGELMQLIEDTAASKKHLLIEAPTGMGKTLAILLPTLRRAMKSGAPAFYVTPKNSQHAAPEQAARQIGGLRTLTLTAKTRICMKGEPVCNPQACEFARDYYQKVVEHDLVAKLGRKRAVTAATLRSFAERYEVCPAELGLDAAPAFDLIIGDYNYVIQPLGLVGRITAKLRGKTTKPAVVIDEAHNLFTRATENQSAVLSVQELQGLGRATKGLALETAVAEAVDRTIFAITRKGPSTRALAFDEALRGELEDLNDRWSAITAQYLGSDVEIAEQDPVLRLTGYWRAFYEVFAQIALAQMLTVPTDSEQNPFACLYECSPGDQWLRVLCCDASSFLAACFEPFARVVGFSATLRPFDFYAKLSGLDMNNLGTAAFNSPFPDANRKVLVIPQVSTKLRDRRQNLDKIATAIVRISAERPGNYMALFPSFQFLRDVSERVNAPGYEIVCQTAGMSQAQTKRIVDRLREVETPVLVMGVQGGSLAEGIDYPGEQLIGVIVVGPALPTCDVSREVLRRYYERVYDPRLGYDYAYTYPAMAKVVQAAGRVIRTDVDRGLIVLMDARFVEDRYSALMPKNWFKGSVHELVSGKILEEVRNFWRGPSLPG